MAACRKHVYKTMCEQAGGDRKGRSGDVRYESRYKRGKAPKASASRTARGY